jgi:ATP-dependent RNA helicase HelY
VSAAEYLERLPFPPDDFQRQAAASLEGGRSVVVTAPTGSGKTLVAEVAIHLALGEGGRAFYTTPIKALSNQKYGDLVTAYGEARVGLLTGDNVINGDAEIVVMTTEVLRNMIYAASPGLDRVSLVVLDEVHYLQDPFRGAVWEEVIIHAPPHVRLVCLSATIANPEEFAAWVGERRGPTDLILARERPVPLEQHYLMRDKVAGELRMFPTFITREGRRRANPRVDHLLSLERGRRRRFSTPRRVETVEHLAAIDLLPAIYFIFSRAGCDAAAMATLQAGVRLSDPAERETIRRVAEEGTAHLSDADLDVLDYPTWLSCLEAGVAAHHAGLVPAFKETVEELFAGGLLKVVFATETLALGINMPARCVVVESLSKFDGEGHQLMQPGDYTQLTGRAGRRGIDTVGHGVVLHSPFLRFSQVTEIAAVGSHPLRSSFRPGYNMAANLVANYSRERAEELLDASFAQYLRVEDQSGTEDLLRALEERLAREEEKARCERGSVDDYRDWLRARRPTAGMAGRLHPGDVVDIPAGPRQGRYLVLNRIRRQGGGMKLLALSSSGRTRALSPREVVEGSTRATTLELPLPVRPGDRRFQQEVLRMLRRVPPAAGGVTSRSRASHPVADCPEAEAHLRWAERARRTRRRIDQLQVQLGVGGAGLVGEFRAIHDLLEEYGYVAGWSLTGRGERLRFLYNELDLLLAESIEQGVFSGLTSDELAALASCFVYEPRSEDSAARGALPTAMLAQRWDSLQAIWRKLEQRQRRARLPTTRRPEPGFAATAYAWAQGSELEDLPVGRLQPGDFVRVARLLVDLLRQLRDAVPELSSVAREALHSVDRGVVAAMGIG